MDGQIYQAAQDGRYAVQYDYQNISTNEATEVPNYGDYLEEGAVYPIGDGQDIDGQFPLGDCSIEQQYAEYRQAREYLSQRHLKNLSVSQPKYATPSTFTVPRRGQVLPKRSTYYASEVGLGDYRRSTLSEKFTANTHPQYLSTPEYATSKATRESLLRNLTDKEYRARIQKLRENRLKQDRLAAAAAASSYYAPEVPLTHDQLQDAFVKNYKLDVRKPTQSTPAQVQNVTSPRSDSAAIRDYYAARKKFLSGGFPKSRDASVTKDTKSEPVQPRKTVESTFQKLIRENSPSKTSPIKSPRQEKREQCPKSINYEAFVSAAQKAEDTDLEVKYKNADFGKINLEDTDVPCQEKDASSYPIESINAQSSITSISQMKDTSDDKSMTPRKEIIKAKCTARSSRSRRSSHTVKSKKYEDLVNLQKSKCTIMSVIYDGIQKCEQAKYEYAPSSKSSKYTKGDLKHTKQSQTDQTETPQSKSLSSSMDILHSEIISNMFKEFRDYHLQNISQEVKRLQYLDVLPKKISKMNST